MNRIEHGLHEHHASLGASSEQNDIQNTSTRSVTQRNAHAPPNRTISDPPFAKVNSVAPSSPAHDAGLEIGDRIISFGAANWRNNENLRKVAEIVRDNEGVCSSFITANPIKVG